VFNGLLLGPQYDAAFDAGLISFEDTRYIIISTAFKRDQCFALHITDEARLNPKRLATRTTRISVTTARTSSSKAENSPRAIEVRTLHLKRDTAADVSPTKPERRN
jgi:hypothetical protein